MGRVCVSPGETNMELPAWGILPALAANRAAIAVDLQALAQSDRLDR